MQWPAKFRALEQKLAPGQLTALQSVALCLPFMLQ